MELRIKKNLHRLNVAPLTFFARTLGLPKALKRKGELIDALANEVEGNLAGVWSALTETEQRILTECAHNGGSCDCAVYKAKYSEWCPTREPEAWSKEASLVWLFCSLEVNRYVTDQALVNRIKEIAPKPSAPSISVLEEIPNEIGDQEFGRRAVHVHVGNDFSIMELGSILSLVKSASIKVNVSTLRPTSYAQQKLADALVDLDFSHKILRQAHSSQWLAEVSGTIRPHAWGVLVQQCGWCKPAGEILRLTDHGVTMLSEKSLDEFRRGVRRFVENDEFDELARIDGLEGPSHYGKRFLSRPSERRRAIRQSMKTWPGDKWIAFDEVFRYLLASDSGFTCYRGSYRSSLGLGPDEETFYSGEYIDRLYLRVFLFESLGTLGLVDLAYAHPAHLWPDFKTSGRDRHKSFFSRYDGLLFIRVNSLGKYCLDQGEGYQHRPTKPKGLFRVLPNQEILIEKYEDLPATGRYMLTSIGKLVSDHVWRLDGAAILKHLEAGGTIKDVVDFLDAHAFDGLPKNVRAHIEDLGRKAALVIDYQESTVVETAGDHVAGEIAGDRRTSKFCMFVSGRFVVVNKRDLRAFRNALRKLGYVLPH